jgi:hypothetical protein
MRKMKTACLIAFAIALLASFISVSCGQPPPETAWTKTFGGSDADRGYSVQQTSDGGYIIAGGTTSFGVGHYDVWLIKTDSSGNMAWNKTFGGPGHDEARSVQQTSDGGYVIAGYTESYGAGGSDVWLIKTDSSGNMAWNKTFGGPDYDNGDSVRQTSDGGYVISGCTESYGAGACDAWLIKTDSSGNMAWNKTFGGPGYDLGISLRQTPDGGYVIAGYTESYGDGHVDAWLIKTDSSGNMAWNKRLGGPGHDEARSVQQTSDGGYVIGGSTQSYGAGSSDFWLIKTDPSGNAAWNKTFGGPDYDEAHSVRQTSDGGYVIVGDRESYEDYFDVWLIKTDSSGDEIWEKSFGGFWHDRGYSVQQTSGGGYIIVGDTASYGAGSCDVWLIKVAA